MDKFDIALGAGQKLWLTSDTHFGHANIIKYCKRPFRDASHMDNMLIRNWNRCVRTGDVVVHLGDFMFKSKTSGVAEIAEQLNGLKYIICGNHDDEDILLDSKAFVQVVEHHDEFLRQEPVQIGLVINGTVSAILSHYPHVMWDRMDVLPMFFGHRHTSPCKARKEDTPAGSLDVGVDNCGYRPIEFWEAVDRL